MSINVECGPHMLGEKSKLKWVFDTFPLICTRYITGLKIGLI